MEALTLKAVSAAFEVTGGPPEKPVSISFLFADDATIRTLNADWRDKDKATNVLSFPAEHPPGMPGPELLGDIILAFETCQREAQEEEKSLINHATHLIIHGTLHLLGYDHIEEEEAVEMESLEIEALATLGIDDPYKDTEISA
ncbi:rRNA maturation RNase YbeY [Microvirga sp. W0021]|uniref:Endoribonuclease YbeY n=1 Tax=Hohaiivirga grylli TaxID=3133970 RepID=A0ABV0BGB8_9HYPH